MIARLFLFVTLLGQSLALDILLTNDDGYESELIQTLFFALQDSGHNVVMSAPYENQSGTSGSVNIMQPILPTADGNDPIGPTHKADGQYYVNSSPAAAVLYGIDILALATFGKKPDLVISGPNKHNNLGLATTLSGTIGAAVTAINKGIPTIAVSCDSPLRGGEINQDLVAQLTVKIVGATAQNIPIGYGLSVNMPLVLENTCQEDYKFQFTSVGRASNYGVQFFENLGDSRLAAHYLDDAHLSYPGVSAVHSYTAAGYPLDSNPNSEGNVHDREDNIVTISPIQGLYTADQAIATRISNDIGKDFPEIII